MCIIVSVFKALRTARWLGWGGGRVIVCPIVSEFLVHGLGDGGGDAVAGDGAEGNFAGGPNLFFAVEGLGFQDAIVFDAVVEGSPGSVEIELAFGFGQTLAVEGDSLVLQD